MYDVMMNRQKREKEAEDAAAAEVVVLVCFHRRRLKSRRKWRCMSTRRTGERPSRPSRLLLGRPNSPRR